MLDLTSNRPEIVWICTESIYEAKLGPIVEGVKIISTGYDFTPQIRTLVLPEGDILEAGVEISGLVKTLSQDYSITLDITSARKALVAGTLLSTTENQPESTYYLKLDTLDDISKPYPMISKQHQELVDFRDQIGRKQR